MSSRVLKVLVQATLAIGSVKCAIGLVLLAPAIPSLVEVISGTTSLALLTERRDFISASLVIGAGSVSVLTSGALQLAQGMIGLKALKSRDFSNLLFISGVALLSTLFEMLLGIEHLDSPLTWLETLLCTSLIVLAEVCRRTNRPDH